MVEFLSSGQYYRGCSNDVRRRLEEHNNGEERSTKSGAPWELVLVIEKTNKPDALKLEKKLKNLGRERLEKFIKKYG